MKAMILAAGLGTRLRPWTLEHPKALVPVAGQPMLKRVVETLRGQGFDQIVVNAHHFAEQIIDYLANQDLKAEIKVSWEKDLLDTGGGLLKAECMLGNDDFLVHNVDILSNADLRGLMEEHRANGADVTLLCSRRPSSRRLLFGADGVLAGWRNDTSGQVREAAARIEPETDAAFSGIYALSPRVFAEMKRLFADKPFPLMDFLLHHDNQLRMRGIIVSDLDIIDIGKPETLLKAEKLLSAQ